MATDTKEEKKIKRPTAEKRQIQNEKKRLVNKNFKSKVRTAIKTFEESLKGDSQETTKEGLNAVYSLLDKGTKRGIYKKNTTSRMKSRLTAKV